MQATSHASAFPAPAPPHLWNPHFAPGHLPPLPVGYRSQRLWGQTPGMVAFLRGFWKPERPWKSKRFSWSILRMDEVTFPKQRSPSSWPPASEETGAPHKAGGQLREVGSSVPVTGSISASHPPPPGQRGTRGSEWLKAHKWQSWGSSTSLPVGLEALALPQHQVLPCVCAHSLPPTTPMSSLSRSRSQVQWWTLGLEILGLGLRPCCCLPRNITLCLASGGSEAFLLSSAWAPHRTARGEDSHSGDKPRFRLCISGAKTPRDAQPRRRPHAHTPALGRQAERAGNPSSALSSLGRPGPPGGADPAYRTPAPGTFWLEPHFPAAEGLSQGPPGKQALAQRAFTLEGKGE